MSKLTRPHWPDEVRLKMIEKSEFYSEPQVYQYGFYDGFQHAQSQTKELQQQNAELVEMLEYIFYKTNFQNHFPTTSIKVKNLLTKYNHLNQKP